jgi:hypothetical protein
VHADQSDHSPVFVLQVRVRVPQLPHAMALSPSHFWPVHCGLHWQLPPQTCTPPRPQARVSFGMHAPSPLHAPNADHWPVAALQSRLREPHMPQASVGAPEQA